MNTYEVTLEDGSVYEVETADEPNQPGSTKMQQVGQAVSNATKTLLSKVPESISSPENIVKNYGPEIPMMGGLVAGPLGAMGGQILRNVGQIAYGDPNAPTTPLSVGGNIVMQGLLSGVPESSTVKRGLTNLAQNMGRRSLGFTKGMIKRLPGSVGEANQVAQTMLDNGVIKFGRGTEGMKSAAENLAEQSGKQIGTTLKEAGGKALNAKEISASIDEQLMPKYGGIIERSFIPSAEEKVPLFTEKKLPEGLYAIEKDIVEEIKNTVKAHGLAEPMDFQSAQDLKETIGNAAKFNKLTDALKAYYNRRAYGIVNRGIETGLQRAADEGKIAAEEIPKYLQNKQLYAAANRAVESLSDAAAGEAANNIISLRGAFAGGMGAATGDLAKLAKGIGAWELLRRSGGSVSAAANFAAKSQGLNKGGSATLQELIGRLIEKYDERRKF